MAKKIGLPSDDMPGLPGVPASEKKPRKSRSKPVADPFSPELNREIEDVAARGGLDPAFVRSLIGEHIDATLLGHVADIARDAVAARLGASSTSLADKQQEPGPL